MKKKSLALIYAILCAIGTVMIFVYWDEHFKKNILDIANIYAGCLVIVSLMYVFSDEPPKHEEKINQPL